MKCRKAGESDHVAKQSLLRKKTAMIHQLLRFATEKTKEGLFLHRTDRTINTCCKMQQNK